MPSGEFSTKSLLNVAQAYYVNCLVFRKNEVCILTSFVCFIPAQQPQAVVKPAVVHKNQTSLQHTLMAVTTGQ